MTRRVPAKQRRESELLLELQRDHGYMFGEIPASAIATRRRSAGCDRAGRP